MFFKKHWDGLKSAIAQIVILALLLPTIVLVLSAVIPKEVLTSTFLTVFGQIEICECWIDFFSNISDIESNMGYMPVKMFAAFLEAALFGVTCGFAGYLWKMSDKVKGPPIILTVIVCFVCSIVIGLFGSLGVQIIGEIVVLIIILVGILVLVKLVFRVGRDGEAAYTRLILQAVYYSVISALIMGYLALIYGILKGLFPGEYVYYAIVIMLVISVAMISGYLFFKKE